MSDWVEKTALMLYEGMEQVISIKYKYFLSTISLLQKVLHADI